ncbi:MAG TPA: GntR family transcriptional regulator [Gammaproteobacteria bacterium]|nr:GntR family transcriptional regulator [Gammaproteobacteria bacterium]
MTDAAHLFRINPSAGTPIYRQLVDQVQRMLSAGELSAGDELPSVRKLAARLEVNPMTVSKAYSLLEAEGWLRRLRGQGMVVAPRHEQPESEAARLALLAPAIEELAAQALELRLSADRVTALLKRQMEGSDERTGT